MDIVLVICAIIAVVFALNWLYSSWESSKVRRANKWWKEQNRRSGLHARQKR